MRKIKRELTELEGIESGFVTFEPLKIHESLKLQSDLDKKENKEIEVLLKLLKKKVIEVKINGEIVKDLSNLYNDVVEYITDLMSGNKKK